MNRLADIVLGPDPKMRERMRMMLIGVYGYTTSTALLAYAVHIGMVEAGPAKALAAMIWIGLATFYILIRTDWSTRLGSPAMDLPQCLYGVATILFAYVITGPVRSSVLMLIALVLVFGMFTLTARQVVLLSLFAVVSLGVVMSVLVGAHPERYDPRIEFIKFVLTASTLPALSAVSFYVAQVRKRLLQQKAELREALTRLEEIAIRDELTKLYNRRHMQQLIEQQMQRQQRNGEGFCVALIDLDHFKQVNDRHGHQVGDQVLQLFARVCQEVLRQTDTLARWGGEEFLLMLSAPDPGVEGAAAALDRVREQLAEQEVVPGLRVTFSAGITEHRMDEPLHETLERADQGLYAAKAAGRNRSVTVA